jgi:hypothetical protein
MTADASRANPGLFESPDQVMPYSQAFYADRSATAIPAAKIVMAELARLLQPASVIDVGCGDGSFLSVLSEFGVVDLRGVEGPWIGDAQLQVPPDSVQRHDLDRPFACERRYDLAVSIEVAEHLRPERAESFVDDLVKLADVILFSAAIPGQGGTHHVNERWQSYWAGLFDRRGFAVVDSLRPALWNNPEVPVPWRQNLLLYANQRGLERWPGLAAARQRTAGQILDLVHPLPFWRARKPRGFGYLLTRQTPAAVGHSLRRLTGHRNRGLNKPI